MVATGSGKKSEKRFLLRTRLLLPTLSLSLMEMPKQQEMTTHLVLVNSSVFTSQQVESWQVVTSSLTCLKNLVLLNSKKLRDLTTSSTSSFSHTEMEFVMVVFVLNAL